MATVNIGNLTFTHKGDYASGTAYVKNDVVYYSTNGNAYIAKQATQGNAPTNATYWNQFAQGSGGIWNAGLSLGTANQVVAVNSGGSALEFQTAAGGSTPAFAAELSSTMTGQSDNSYFKVNCNTEILDSNGTYDNSSNYRFTPGVAGKYFIYGHVLGRGDSDGLRETKVAIYKNGSRISHVTSGNQGSEVGTSYDGTSTTIGVILDSDDNDYFELYTQIDVASGNVRAVGAQGKTVFGGFKIV